MILTTRMNHKLGIAAALLAGIAMITGSVAQGADKTAKTAKTAKVTTKTEVPSTRIVLLGTGGGPVARFRRAQPATLLQVGDRSYLVDSGDGVMRQLAAVGYQARDIDRLFITHLHMDHMAGLSMLIALRWTARATAPLLVTGPAGTRSVVDGAYAYMRVPAGIFARQLPPGGPLDQAARVVEIGGEGPSVVYQDDLVKVTAVENSHYDTMDKGSMPDGTRSYALRFDTPGRSVVFTGDTGPSEKLERLAKGADVLVTEVIDLPGAIAYLKAQYRVSDEALKPQVAHMSDEHFVPEEIGKMAARAGVSMVVLTHAVMGFDGEKDMRRYTDGVRRHFKGPVVMGQDLDEF